MLTAAEIAEFTALVDHTLATHAQEFESGFVAESAAKLRRLPQYYAALAAGRPFPPAACNAPWVSAVVEADGSLRPCFFHEPIGNVRDTPLNRLVSRELRRFRESLDVAADPICGRCVCSTRIGWRGLPWH
jgi:MoaA/NifB/PqqE/SkfB family radical SAM enzyme